MFCTNCGNQCKDGAKFCPKCGARLLLPAEMNGAENMQEKRRDAADSILSDGASESVNQESANWRSVNKELANRGPMNRANTVGENAALGNAPDPGNDGNGSRKKKKGLIALLIVVVLAVAAVVAALFFFDGGGTEKQYEKHMEAGRTYLEEESYDEAVAEFEEAIAIDENVVEPYQLMAQAYISLEDDEKADETYDTVRELIVTTYEDSDGEELLEDAKEVYLEAVAYYGEQGDAETVQEVADEIIEMLPDEEDVQEVTEAASQYLIGEEEDAEENTEEEVSAEVSESEEEWSRLYADYLGTAEIEEEYYFLIYLNNDDIPEVLFNGTYNAAGSTLYYIQDGQVKEKALLYVEPTYAERGGYITAYVNRMGGCQEQVLYLDDDNELHTIFEGSYSYADEANPYIDQEDDGLYSDVMVNGESVSVSEYLSRYEEAIAWETESGCALVNAGIDGNAYLLDGNYSLYDACVSYDLTSMLEYLDGLN